MIEIKKGEETHKHFLIEINLIKIWTSCVLVVYKSCLQLGTALKVKMGRKKQTFTIYAIHAVITIIKHLISDMQKRRDRLFQSVVHSSL